MQIIMQCLFDFLFNNSRESSLVYNMKGKKTAKHPAKCNWFYEILTRKKKSSSQYDRYFKSNSFSHSFIATYFILNLFHHLSDKFLNKISTYNEIIKNFELLQKKMRWRDLIVSLYMIIAHNKCIMILWMKRWRNRWNSVQKIYEIFT